MGLFYDAKVLRKFYICFEMFLSVAFDGHDGYINNVKCLNPGCWLAITEQK